MAVHFDILEELKRRVIANLKLFRQGDTEADQLDEGQVKIRELPRKGERLDRTPLIVFAPFGETTWDTIGFEEPSLNMTYYVEGCVISAAKLGMSEGRQALYMDWANTLGGLMVPKDLTSQCPTVWRTELLKSPVFDRSKLDAMYAYQSSVARYDSQESRPQ